MSEQPLRVLLALDDASLRVLFAQYLHECGYTVDQASASDELLAQIDGAQGQYDAIVLDDHLRSAPDCDVQSLGIQLVAEIKARYPSIAFIVFAQGELNSELEALRAGAHRYIRRPLDPEELGMLIGNAVEHQRLKGVAREKQILERLLETSAALLGEHDLPDVLNTICRAAFELFDVDHSGLVLFDPPYECGWVVAEYPSLGMLGISIPVCGVPAEEQLIQAKEPLFIRDIANEPTLGLMQDIYRLHNIRSILIVPVVFKGRILGSFGLDAIGRLRDFMTEELDLCKIFAGQAAAAIENAKLFTATKRHADQLETVRQTTLAITSQLNRDILLRTIIQQAVGLLSAKSGGIYEYASERGELSIIADYGRPQNLLGKTLQVSEGMAGRLVQTGDPFMIVDDYNGWLGRARTYADNRPFGAVIEVPLKWQEHTIGVLYVDDSVGRTFTPQDADLLRLFADHAAIALVNADLVTRDTEKLRRLERLSQASSVIMGNLGDISLDERLNLIARHAADILDAEGCGIFLIKRPGFLSLEASYGHREGYFPKRKEFAILSGKRTGLTGYIAYEAKLFNLQGDILTNHFAVKKDEEPAYISSGQCYSLLAIPLKNQRGDSEELVGLLRVDNKQGRNGAAGPEIGFTQEDEWLLRLFADAALVAIESADLVAKLREREDMLTRLVDSSPNGVIAIDLDGNVTGFNVRAQEILDYQPAEVLGKPVEALYINRQEAGKVGQRLRNAPDGKLADYDSFVRSKSGERIPIRLATTRLYDAHGQPIGSVGYFEDLRSIKETEQRLALLLNASNVVAQAENLTDGLQSLAEIMVKFLNRTFCRIFLLDEHQRFLVTKAEHPIMPLNDGLAWRPRLGERITVADWPRLARFLAEAETKLILRTSSIGGRSRFIEWAQSLGLHPNLQSLLIIPLKTRRRVVGMLVLGEARHWDRAPFSPEKQELATAIADQTAVLIDRMQLHETTDRRRRLLTTLDEASRHIRAEREPAKLQQTVVRLATQLLGCTVAGLYINRPHLTELELRAVYGLPDDLIGARQPHAQGVMGLIARIGKAMIVQESDNWLEREHIFVPYGFKTIIGVPLRQAGEVREVLFVADTTGASQLGEIDLEILERFALQAAPALHISRLMSREQRMFSQLNTLHHISDYIQAAGNLDKVLHVVLTGITAGYGLGFNRAALLLLDERGEYLIGQMGIGYIAEAEAQTAWTEHYHRGMEDFGQYLKQLEHNQLPLTPVGERIRALRLPMRSAETAIFWRGVSEGHYIFETQAELDRLPISFIDAFEPGLPLVIAPLMVRDQEIGFLVADNKFTASPITSEDVESLLTFVNTAALVIENTRLYRETKAAQERLQSFYEASNALVAAQAPERVLQDTVERARQAAWASGVSVILIDELHQTRHLATAGTNKPSDISDVSRPNGLSMRVMSTGSPEVIENTDNHRDQLNPSEFWRAVASALCLPLLLEGRRIGVMWFYYHQQHYFSQSEIEAIQLYVNQAAVAYDSARRIKELEHLRQVAEALASALGLKDVLEQIVRSAQELLQADSAVIWSYDTVRNRFGPESWGSVSILPELLGEVQKGDLRLDGTALTIMEHGFSPANWEPVSIPQEFSEEVQKEKGMLRLDGTHLTIMERGWVGVRNVGDEHAYPFLGSSSRTLFERIGVQSFQGIALRVGDEKLGVLYVNYNHPRSFSEEERQIAQTFANHATLALKKAKLLEQLGRAHNVARVVSEVTVLEDLSSTLGSVVEGTQSVLSCDAVTIYAYDQATNQLSTAITSGVWHPDRAVSSNYVPEHSIVRQLLLRDEMYIVESSIDDPLFRSSRFTKDERVIACVAIPLKVGNEIVGVMFVNHRVPHRFTPDELTTAELFANQAAVAIRNAQLYEETRTQLEELERTKKMLGAHTAVAWMGMASSTWHHMISNHATTIRDLVALAEQDIDRDPPLAKLRERLSDINTMARKIQETPITAPLSTEEGVGSVSINELLRERIAQLWKHEPYRSIKQQQDFGLDDQASVRTNPDWLRRAFDILIDNAVDAMAQSHTRHLILTTSAVEKGVEITITDTGPGIPADMYPKLFHEPIMKPKGAKGMGMGLLIAQLIVHMHDGEIDCKTTSSEGTTMRVWLPLET